MRSISAYAIFLGTLWFGAGCDKPSTTTAAPPPPAPNQVPGKAQPKLPTIKLWLGAEELATEVARTIPQIQTGMMFRESMEENEGMLFLLPSPQRASFYMRNTLIPLSCAYIDAEGEILEIHDMKPRDETPILASSDRILYVLETRQGWFERHKIGVGTVVRTERGSLKETVPKTLIVPPPEREMKVALAQINTTVGDFAGNEAKLLDAYRRGVEAGVEMVVAPELATTGYPPRDLLLKSGFVRANLQLLDRLAAATGPTGLLVGYVAGNTTRPGREAANAVALLQNGKIVATRVKTLLPTYDVFDEDRYFEPAKKNPPVKFNDRKIGLTICEDVWNDEDFWRDRRYRRNPVDELVESGAEIIFNVSASPWHLGKDRTRNEMLRSLAHKTRAPLVYSNLVGGNDELIFDGNSVVFNGAGELVAQARPFEEDFVVVDTDAKPSRSRTADGDEKELFAALVLGLRDYLHKCGFTSAVLGLSGGIDSALVACLAAAALGRENVRGLSLPSQFSSPGSLEDARVLAASLGIRYDVIPIQPAFESVKHQLAGVFEGRPDDTSEENIQARLRGVILMAMSNKFGSLLLTTGNKSELAVGYCTLYGDMCGGLAVISDVPKTMVYRLARWINRDKEIIPAASITKPPSAELRPDQTDQDSLPPYEVLDAILEEYVVRGMSAVEIIRAGFEDSVVKRVVRLIDGAEYKRRQAAPGLKVTSKAFGVGRRIPIAQRYREG